MTCVLILQMRRTTSESSQKSYKRDFSHATSDHGVILEPKLFLLTFLRTLLAVDAWLGCWGTKHRHLVAKGKSGNKYPG